MTHRVEYSTTRPQQPCDRCHLTSYPRVALNLSTDYDHEIVATLYLCIICLAAAIDARCEWKLVQQVAQWDAMRRHGASRGRYGSVSERD